jgi:hypothetical protein
MIFALPLLLAAVTRVELIPSQTIEVSPHNWGQFSIDLRQRPALIDATYLVESGSDGVRMALLRRDDLERLRNDEPAGALALSEPGRSGSLNYQVREPGSYVMVVDNRSGSRPATVRLNVWLDFAEPSEPGVTELSTGRRVTVVLISCAVFFGVVTFSARRLWGAIRR